MVNVLMFEINDVQYSTDLYFERTFGLPFVSRFTQIFFRFHFQDIIRNLYHFCHQLHFNK